MHIPTWFAFDWLWASSRNRGGIESCCCCVVRLLELGLPLELLKPVHLLGDVKIRVPGNGWLAVPMQLLLPDFSI